MILLKIKRIAFKPDYTIGRLYINGDYFCDTLENPVRELPKICPDSIRGLPCHCPEKMAGQTAIPVGSYVVTLTYSPRFKRLLPRLLDVPHFEGILIHRGNTVADSSGCILVGENKNVGMVLNSTAYEMRLMKRLEGESAVTLEVS